MQLSALCTDALAYLDSLGLSRHTHSSYDIAYRQFTSHIIEKLKLANDAKHFTSEAAVSFMVALHQGAAGPNTIRARYSALKFLDAYGATRKDGRGRPVTSGNLLVGVRLPKKNRPREKWLQPVELLAWLEVKRPMWINIIRDLLLDLSIRVAELCNANVGDLDELHGEVYLSVIVKGGHPARLPISPEVADGIKDWLLSRNMPDPGEPLLLDRYGKRIDPGALSYIVQKIATDAGITRLPVTPHVIRHTMNVIRRQGGIDSMIRSKLLTHTSPASIISYEHVSAEELVPARAQQRRALAKYLDSAKSSVERIISDGLSPQALPESSK